METMNVSEALLSSTYIETIISLVPIFVALGMLAVVIGPIAHVLRSCGFLPHSHSDDVPFSDDSYDDDQDEPKVNREVSKPIKRGLGSRQKRRNL